MKLKVKLQDKGERMEGNIDDFVTLINNQEDEPFLRTKLFNVNLRLFRTSNYYREIVLKCCKYIQEMALSTLEGYKKPHGMSGANLAIPFNIVGIVRNRNQKNEYCQVMINPLIVDSSSNEVLTSSNCGSIRFDKPINIYRDDWITVEWYDLNGKLNKGLFERSNCGFTVQHEIDHNLGILITDRRNKKR